MQTDTLALLIPIFGVVIGCPTFLVGLALFFPSTRRAINARLTGSAVTSESLDAQLAGTNAQLAAIRGEVYALRCELAAVAQSLPSGPKQEALPRG
jgi:hypothetical protein